MQHAVAMPTREEFNNRLQERIQTSVENFEGRILKLSCASIENAAGGFNLTTFINLFYKDDVLMTGEFHTHDVYPFQRILIGTVTPEWINRYYKGIKNFLKTQQAFEPAELEYQRLQRDLRRAECGAGLSWERVYGVLKAMTPKLERDNHLFSYCEQTNRVYWEGTIIRIS